MTPVDLAQLKQSMERSQDYLLSLQHPEGYWWATLESNVTMTAELVLLYFIWGIAERLPLEKIKNYVLNQQRDHGGWELYYDDGGGFELHHRSLYGFAVVGLSS